MRASSLRPQPVGRHLAVVLAADIAEYSRLMGADEEGTLARLRACLRGVIEPSVARRQGRIVKTTGDGLLAEFVSPVEAVRCAVEWQQAISERGANEEPDKRLRFRIGINVGDVMVDDKDIYGDAVNIAARLEGLSDPGGVCLSQTAYEQIRDRVAFPFTDDGEQAVRNIARPVRVYSLTAEAIAALPKIEVASEPSAAGTRNKFRHGRAAAALLGALIVILVSAWFLWPLAQSPNAPAKSAVTAAPTSVSRLSIVVLPFANFSNDPDQQYFADGITDDLTTDLSRIADMVVIARNTAFTYLNKPIDAKQIGSELSVRYVLEGSVQRSGDQVRVNAQLIDAVTDAHLWAERFDGDTGNLFALQDEITGRIAVALNLELTAPEAARPTEHPDALDYILRGRAALFRPISRDSYAQAISFYEHALAIDPRSVEAQSLLATALAGRVLDILTDTSKADIDRAKELAEQALAAAPRSPLAHYAKGQALRAQRRYVEAIPEYETALASNRNWVTAIFVLGQCKMFAGSIEETIPLVERAIRLSPRDPQLALSYYQIGLVHLLQTRTDDAIVWAEKARNANPDSSYVHILLAAAYGLNGEIERAAAELAEARRLTGNGSWPSIAAQHIGSWAVPKIRALIEATYFTGLRKAGMPEE